jgi:hypothetical protein
MSQLIPIFLIIFLIVAVLVIGAYLSNQEQAEIADTPQEIAQQLGLSYVGQWNWEQLQKRGLTEMLGTYVYYFFNDPLNFFPFQPSQLQASFHDIFIGQIKGVEVLVFTYKSLSRKNDLFSLPHSHTIFALRPNPENNFPSFVIRPVQFLDKLKQTIGQKIHPIPAAPQLLLQTYQPDYFAQVPPAVWQLIESNQWHVIHDKEQGWFMVYAFNHTVQMNRASYQTFIKVSLELYFGFLPNSNQLKAVFEE